MSRRVVLIVLGVLAGWQLLSAGWVQARGLTGQWLMEKSWQQQEHGNPPGAPWPGARTRPVARLHVPDLAIDRLVVEGIETPNLAWGPGIATGESGHTVIAAHRDTHFRFLGRLEPEHRIELEYPAGQVGHWRVTSRHVVDSRTTAIDLDAPGPALTLITCWPLDAIETGGPLRLVVSAEPEADA
ncbi:MAG: sortase domain-bontaining protein [Wenzhouxiangellaceae bacterium]